jgi:hypothetical protein
MRIKLTCEVRTDNDPSCNTYTYQATTFVGMLDHLPVVLPGFIEETLEAHKQTFPHNHNLPAFRPVTVSAIEVIDAVLG